VTPADARALRRRKAADLREAEPGLSLRKMARRLGVSRDTVARDLEEHDRRAAGSAPPVEDVAEPVAHSAPVVDALAADAEDGRGAAVDSAPQASDVAAESAPPVVVAAAEAAEVAPPTQDSIPDEAQAVAHPAPAARQPRRLADTELTIDLRQWPGLRRDLAVLAETGVSPEALINQAVVVLTHGYKQGVRCGAIRPDRPFVVRDLIVGPPRSYPRRPAPPRDAASGPGTS